MPVTIRSAAHPPRKWAGEPQATTSDQLLSQSCSEEASKSLKVVHSSFGDIQDRHVSSSPNGFVWAAIRAYSDHYHLTIRPEDVWLAILTQFSFYVNKNAEDLRSRFVAHEGQKEVVVTAMGTIDTVDVGELALKLTDEMQKHLLDADLQAWVLPRFTTTRPTDVVSAAVLMMGTMQKYFTFTMCLMCGIPSITLLGEKEDWAEIRARLDKLDEFGEEPARFRRLLVPVLDSFIRAFERPDDPLVLDFWSKIAQKKSMGSGPTYLSGWITAFCFWDVDGVCLDGGGPKGAAEQDDDAAAAAAGSPEQRFDSSIYHRLDSDKIPAGYASVPVLVADNGVEIKTRMVAGSVGIQVSSSGQPLDESRYHDSYSMAHMFGAPSAQPEIEKFTPKVGENSGLDSLQPATGWWMYILREEPEDRRRD